MQTISPLRPSIPAWELTPEGHCEFRYGQASFCMRADGTILIKNSAASLRLDSRGEIHLNTQEIQV